MPALATGTPVHFDTGSDLRALASCCTPPQVFAPNEISMPGRSEHRIAFSPDGRTVVYSVALDAYPWDALLPARRPAHREARWPPTGPR